MPSSLRLVVPWAGILLPCTMATHVTPPLHEFKHDPTAIDQHIDNLSSRLLQSTLHQPHLYSEAISIIESLGSAPSCHRLATTTLIDSCKALETGPETEIALSDIREKYATRLAVCELQSAKSDIPAACQPFAPSDSGCGHKSSGFMRILRGTTKHQGTVERCFEESPVLETHRCLQALHSKPQWWTSYSNALQNVLVVCQASRHAIEKGGLCFLSSLLKRSPIPSNIGGSRNHWYGLIESGG